MQVDFASSGGVTRRELTFRANTDTMPEDQARELLALLESSGVFEMAQADVLADVPVGRADVISYRLSLSGTDRQTTLWMNDVTAPSSLHPLLSYLRRLAKEQHSGSE